MPPVCDVRVRLPIGSLMHPDAGANLRIDECRRTRIPAGIHVGDVVEESDGDLMGDGVNIAARLEGIAKPGAIYLSEQAYWQVKGRLDLKVTDLHATQLKNIAEPIHVYSLEVGEPAQKPAPPPPALERPEPPRLSLVVLPFANMGGDPEQDYFADGIIDDLTTDLSHLPDSFVIARGTAFTYKGKPIDAKQIGRELGVRYVLEGSVRRVGETIAVNAQLISTVTGAHIWADRFDGERSRLGQLEIEFVSRLANSLGVELVKAEAFRAQRERGRQPRCGRSRDAGLDDTQCFRIEICPCRRRRIVRARAVARRARCPSHDRPRRRNNLARKPVLER